jgi:hypothetical protein
MCAMKMMRRTRRDKSRKKANNPEKSTMSDLTYLSILLI